MDGLSVAVLVTCHTEYEFIDLNVILSFLYFKSAKKQQLYCYCATAVYAKSGKMLMLQYVPCTQKEKNSK